MIQSKGNKKSYIITSLILLALATYVFTLSRNVVWLGDDYGYTLHCRTMEPIKSISDIFDSQNYHYFTTNGRYVAHFIVQLFDGLFGKLVFSIANSLMYIGLAFLIARYVGIKFNESKYYLLIALSIGVVFITIFGPAFQVGYVCVALYDTV